MNNFAAEVPFGTQLLRVVRIIALATCVLALVEFISLKVFEQQNSCLAYIEIMPLMTLALGVSVAGATAILASIAEKFEYLVKSHYLRAFRLFFLVVVPVAISLFYLLSEYVPLFETYMTDPAVFCD